MRTYIDYIGYLEHMVFFLLATAGADFLLHLKQFHRCNLSSLHKQIN